MRREYDRALYILPFDHRGSFQAKMFGWKSPLSEAQTAGFIGFAAGRTVFWDPPVAWRSKKVTREQTVALIAKRHRELVDLFERANIRLSSELSGRSRSRCRSSKEA